MSTDITYTFPADYPHDELRGVTFTGGSLTRIVVDRKPVDAVAFKATLIGGRTVTARLDNKSDLQAAVAEAKAEEQRIEDAKRAVLEAAIPGLSQYEAAMRNYSNAMEAYNRASERGYPAREAAAADAADKALTAIHEQYPATVAWRKIEAYCLARNHDKSAAGDVARRSVQAGGDVFSAAEKMEADWKSAAERAMWNS